MRSVNSRFIEISVRLPRTMSERELDVRENLLAATEKRVEARLAEINERLAALGTSFAQNVLADEQGYTLVLEGEDDLAGLPDFVRAAAKAAAEERDLAGKHVITTSRSSVEPFLQFSARRDLREIDPAETDSRLARDGCAA